MKEYRYIKRILDIILSVIALIILLPVFLIIAVLIKIESKGPIFFAHKRVGKNGKNFKLWKFRTMVPNAEELIKEFNQQQKEEYKNKFKLEDDPRVTKLGKILRKIGLDELPQLVNIIKGELSIVGPRPIIKEELEKYEENKEKFLSIKPGLVGYWGANANKNTTYKERMQMELYYIDNVSWELDLKIVIKTFITIFRRFSK